MSGISKHIVHSFSYLFFSLWVAPWPALFFLLTALSCFPPIPTCTHVACNVAMHLLSFSCVWWDEATVLLVALAGLLCTDGGPLTRNEWRRQWGWPETDAPPFFLSPFESQSFTPWRPGSPTQWNGKSPAAGGMWPFHRVNSHFVAAIQFPGGEKGRTDRETGNELVNSAT